MFPKKSELGGPSGKLFRFVSCVRARGAYVRSDPGENPWSASFPFPFSGGRFSLFPLPSKVLSSFSWLYRYIFMQATPPPPPWAHTDELHPAGPASHVEAFRKLTEGEGTSIWIHLENLQNVSGHQVTVRTKQYGEGGVDG